MSVASKFPDLKCFVPESAVCNLSCFRRERKDDGEGCAQSFGTFYPDVPMMTFDDLPGQVEADAEAANGSIWFARAIKTLEYMGEV